MLPRGTTTEGDFDEQQAIQKAKRLLSSAKIAAPLVRATIRRPGVDARDMDIGKTFAILSEKVRDLTHSILDGLQAKGLLPYGRGGATVHRLAQQVAYIVANHWEQHSRLSRDEILALYESAMRTDFELPDDAIHEPPYEGAIHKDVEYTLSWIRAKAEIAIGISGCESGMGHAKPELVEAIMQHLQTMVRRWADEFPAPSRQQRMVTEQSLLHILAPAYTPLWVNELEEMKRFLASMSPEQAHEYVHTHQRKYDLRIYFGRVERHIEQLKDMQHVVVETLMRPTRSASYAPAAEAKASP